MNWILEKLGVGKWTAVAMIVAAVLGYHVTAKSVAYYQGKKTGAVEQQQAQQEKQDETVKLGKDARDSARKSDDAGGVRKSVAAKDPYRRD